MKRLITIFVSSVLGFSLWGQEKLPVTVLGDVFIASNGEIISEGTVHLQAVLGTGVGKVANYGNLKMDSVIFYSNDSIEGLLMNQTLKDSVSTEGVVVRKNFVNKMAWYQISLPFDVNLNSGVFDPATGEKMIYYTDFYVQTYDPQLRAQRGVNDNENWVTLPATLTADNEILPKGTACRFAVDVEFDNVDFRANTDQDITDLFNRDVKGLNLTYAKCPSGKFVDSTMYKSEGWNAFGGLNAADYEISSSTVNYDRTVYYWGMESTKYEELLPSAGEKGTLRPYAVIFVQTNETTDTVFKKSTTPTGGFFFLGDGSGLKLNPDILLPLFRSSSSNADYDLFKLNLTNAATNVASRIYFKFNDNYSLSFNPSEGDDIRLETYSKTDPIVWALAPNEDLKGGTVAFVDCLPYSENEVPLGVNIPAAGNYTFSMSNVTIAKGIESAILRDKDNNIDTDLLKSNYDFKSDSTNTSDRFVLFLNKTITSIDRTTTADIYAYAENNTITVKNLNSGDKVQILDMTGRTLASGIASGNTYSTPVNQKGVYIVSVRGGEKTLKVLNK